MAAGLELEINGTEPVQPATGFSRVFIDADGDLAYKRVDGTVGKVKGGGIINLAGYDLTLGADSTLAGSLTGGGEVQVASGAVAQVLRSGVGMLRGSGEAANRVPFFGTNTDMLDGDAGMTYDKANDRLTVAGGLVAPGMRPAADSTTAIQLMNAAGSAVLTVDTTNSKVDVDALQIGGVDVPYAVGSWTPMILGTISNPTPTYTTRTGLYTRIGNLCFAFFTLTTSAISGGGGYLKIGGLPITVASVISYAAITGKFSLGSGYSQPGVTPIVSTTQMYLIKEKNESDTELLPVAGWLASSFCSGLLIYGV